jgi:hypothetical protein
MYFRIVPINLEVNFESLRLIFCVTRYQLVRLNSHLSKGKSLPVDERIPYFEEWLGNNLFFLKGKLITGNQLYFLIGTLLMILIPVFVFLVGVLPFVCDVNHRTDFFCGPIAAQRGGNTSSGSSSRGGRNANNLRGLSNASVTSTIVSLNSNTPLPIEAEASSGTDHNAGVAGVAMNSMTISNVVGGSGSVSGDVKSNSIGDEKLLPRSLAGIGAVGGVTGLGASNLNPKDGQGVWQSVNTANSILSVAMSEEIRNDKSVLPWK